MKQLHLYNVANMDELNWPGVNAHYSLQSPALEFITDFRHHEPITTDSGTTADEMRSFMLHTHIHTVCVLDSRSRFIGVIHLEDLSDQAILRKQAEGYRRSDIKVTDLMLPRKDLPAFDLDELETATISDVLDTLKARGKRSCLVLDQHTHSIKGIVSVSEISRRLGTPIEIRQSSDFYRVFAPIALASR